MVKFVLEISEREKKALQKASKEVKRVFKKAAGAFQLKVVKDKAKESKKKTKKKKR